MMRPLVMDFPDDPVVVDISDQYMFGPCLMVNPVYRYKARERMVYFPENTGWYELHTGRYMAGGQWLEVEAPYEVIPLYAREGSILPVGPALEYVDQKPADPLHFYIFGGADGEFNLYEDEGLNYNYEKGDFAAITFRYKDDSRTLIIEDRQGKFDGMLDQRTFLFTLITGEHKRPIGFEEEAQHTLQYDGRKIEFQL